MDEVCVFTNVRHGYGRGTARVEVLCGVSLTLRRGETAALTGPSGSGKSTLLHLAGALEKAEHGEVCLLKHNLSRMSEDARTALRGRSVGVVYQSHRLLPEFDALENAALPLLLAGVNKIDAHAQAADLLSKLGLQHRLHHRPGTLSGGEQQRVAIARALIRRPVLLLADEPTGNLDPVAADTVFNLLLQTAAELGTAVLLATHDPERARALQRQVRMRAGTVEVSE